MDSNYVIFYTEDDIDDQEIFLEALNAVGSHAKLFVQNNGSELLHELKHGEVKPDVIFLDLNMPGRSGFETLQEIKADEILKLIPVIILTTSNDVVIIKRAKQLGASMFVTKPRDFKDYMEVMRLLLAINWCRIPPETKTFVLNINI